MFSSRNSRQVVLPGARLIGYKETQKRDADVRYPKDIRKEPSEIGRKTLRPQNESNTINPREGEPHKDPRGKLT